MGLFDATNSNVERRYELDAVSNNRSYIANRCAEAGFRVLFLESVCNDEELIRKNCEMKLNSPGNLCGVIETRRLSKSLERRSIRGLPAAFREL